MADREKVIKAINICLGHGKCEDCPYCLSGAGYTTINCRDHMLRGALALLKEQEKKQITLHKKHVITWKRNDEFSMRKLYEAVCETLLDEGELFIARTDDHEKVDFVFYVTEGR